MIKIIPVVTDKDLEYRDFLLSIGYSIVAGGDNSIAVTKEYNNG